jgi:hypothetical protein
MENIKFWPKLTGQEACALEGVVHDILLLQDGENQRDCILNAPKSLLDKLLLLAHRGM